MSNTKHEIKIPVKAGTLRGVRKAIKDGEIPHLFFTKDISLKGQVDSILLCQVEKEIDPNEYIAIGANIEKLKAKHWLLHRGKQSSKLKEEDNVFKMNVDQEIHETFISDYGKDTEYVGKIVKPKSGKVALKFNAENIKNRSELIKRVALILDGVVSIKQNIKNRKFERYLEKQKSHLKEICPNVMVNKVNYVRMKGQDLIDKGIALGYPHMLEKNAAEKVIEFLSKQVKQYDYFYRGIKIAPEGEYVVKLKKPIKLDTPVKINYDYEIDLAYDFGQQLYEGGGIDEVNSFAEHIANITNLAHKEEMTEEQIKDANTDKGKVVSINK